MTTAVLRFCLAVIVIGFHCGYAIGGPFAVLVFFVLSGGVSVFLLNSQSPMHFLISRVRSLVPGFLVVAVVQWFVLLAIDIRSKSISIASTGQSPSELDLFSPNGLLNLFIPYYVFEAWPLRFGAGSRILPIFWTVLNELHYYAAAGLLVAVGSQKRRLLHYATLVASFSLLAALAFASQNDLGAINSNVYFNAPSGFAFFLMGFHTLKSLEKPVSRTKTRSFGGLWTATLIVLTLTVLMKPIFMVLGRISTDPSVQWMIFALTVAVLGTFHLLESRGSFVEGRFRSLPELIISRSAYFIYIWQVPFLTLIGHPQRMLPAAFYSAKLTVFLFVLCCTVTISILHASIGRQIRINRSQLRSKRHRTLHKLP